VIAIGVRMRRVSKMSCGSRDVRAEDPRMHTRGELGVPPPAYAGRTRFALVRERAGGPVGAFGSSANVAVSASLTRSLRRNTPGSTSSMQCESWPTRLVCRTSTSQRRPHSSLASHHTSIAPRVSASTVESLVSAGVGGNATRVGNEESAGPRVLEAENPPCSKHTGVNSALISERIDR